MYQTAIASLVVDGIPSARKGLAKISINKNRKILEKVANH